MIRLPRLFSGCRFLSWSPEGVLVRCFLSLNCDGYSPARAGQDGKEVFPFCMPCLFFPPTSFLLLLLFFVMCMSSACAGERESWLVVSRRPLSEGHDP
jgi:hypothetical protein